jgi:L-amino acid N-acyltransferase YncA
MLIREASPGHAPQIAEIYNYYIENSHSTFETEAIDGAEMLRRMEEGRAAGYPFFVCTDQSEITGYAYGRRFRPRSAYLHSIEISVYVKHTDHGRGIGTLLYESLLAEIVLGGFHAVIGGISLPNDASIRLHEKFGFQKVAHFREIGHKFGRWIDVGYWELLMKDARVENSD